MTNQTTAYIFDLDGTLLDSMWVWSKVDVDFLKKRGLAVPEGYGGEICSMSFPEAAAYTIKLFDLQEKAEDILEEWRLMAAQAYENTVQLKPFAKEYLCALRERGAKLAVATSSMPTLFEAALRKHGIFHWFDVVCTAQQAGSGKSRPDIFLLTAQKLGVRPFDCMVFEDILSAVKSAKSIGMTVCGVFDQASSSDWEEIKQLADHAIVSFADAPL